MRLDYVKFDSVLQDDHWKASGDGKREGLNARFKRVAAGLVLPSETEPDGIVLVLGERYNHGQGPAVFDLIDGVGGSWQKVEAAVGSFRQRYQFGLLICEPGERDNRAIKNLPGLRWGAPTIPAPYDPDIPKDALTETSRQQVDDLIEQKRLRVDKTILDQAPAQATRALQCMIYWLTDNPARYPQPSTRKVPPSWMSM
jgi:hypothetical protein